MTASPRLNCSSTRITPTGSRLLPRRNAATAPASMTSVPFGSSEPAIHFLRDVTGVPGVRKQVLRAGSAIGRTVASDQPEQFTMWAPGVVLILAASILVCIPPRDNSDGAAP